jgi:LuxR family transcriptional regulator, quorum-sensing system regulator BjaR1
VHQFLELGDLFARLTSDRTIGAICASMKQYAARFGFTRLAAFDLTRNVESFGEATIWSDAPPEAMSVLDRHGTFSDHPIVQVARMFRDPFTLSALPIEDGAELRRFLCAGTNAGDDAEILVVPVTDGTATVAIVFFFGPSPDMSPLSHDRLKLAIQAGLLRAKQLRASAEGSPPPVLTPREYETLRWVSAGKTDDEIAEILSITPRTVRFHVDNAKIKLKVATRVQAVAKWLRESPTSSFEQQREAS